MTTAHRSLARPFSTNLNRQRSNMTEGRVSGTLNVLTHFKSLAVRMLQLSVFLGRNH